MGNRHLVALLADESGSMELVWFKSIEWISNQLRRGVEYVVNGRVLRFLSQYNIAHPEMEAAHQARGSRVRGVLLWIL